MMKCTEIVIKVSNIVLPRENRGVKSFFEDFVHLKFGLADEMVNVDKTAEMRKLANVATKRAAVQFLDITLKYERIAAANTNLRISMFCLACEYWEEIHGRDYRSTI